MIVIYLIECLIKLLFTEVIWFCRRASKRKTWVSAFQTFCMIHEQQLIWKLTGPNISVVSMQWSATLLTTINIVGFRSLIGCKTTTVGVEWEVRFGLVGLTCLRKSQKFEENCDVILFCLLCTMKSPSEIEGQLIAPGRRNHQREFSLELPLIFVPTNCPWGLLGWDSIAPSPVVSQTF